MSSPEPFSRHACCRFLKIACSLVEYWKIRSGPRRILRRGNLNGHRWLQIMESVRGTKYIALRRTRHIVCLEQQSTSCALNNKAHPSTTRHIVCLVVLIALRFHRRLSWKICRGGLLRFFQNSSGARIHAFPKIDSKIGGEWRSRPPCDSGHVLDSQELRLREVTGDKLSDSWQVEVTVLLRGGTSRGPRRHCDWNNMIASCNKWLLIVTLGPWW